MDIGRPEIFFVAFIGFLILLFMLVARISGWTALATFYRLSGSFSGECRRFQSAELRWKMGYNNFLTVGVNPAGLYLSVFFLFRFGHPNLFIPWADISVTKGEKGFRSIYIEFRFRQAPTIPFRVNERLAQRMMGLPGSSWPGRGLDNKGDLERREG